MNQPTIKLPNRKRRRWIAAASLLIIGGCAGWWFWPRGDARFVGTWVSYQAGNPKPEILQLQANGIGTYDPAPTSIGAPSFGGRSSRFRWQVSNGRLLVRGWRSTLFSAHLNQVAARLTGRSFIIPDQALEVVSVDKDLL